MRTNAFISVTGRFLLSLLFMGSGLSKLSAFDATVSYISSFGLPFSTLVYFLTITIEVVGGLMLLVGYKSRFIAVCMGLFTLLAAVIFHSNFSDQNQMVHFMKNLAIVGGLLQIGSFGPGTFSLDNHRRTKNDERVR
ncbi:DoxX family protein [Vibrio rumoiensis]|uniref:DoxX family protein n=1 Tax=Vibrio rumoiensis TaxID=76258 RepID=UPI003AA91C75